MEPYPLIEIQGGVVVRVAMKWNDGHEDELTPDQYTVVDHDNLDVGEAR